MLFVLRQMSVLSNLCSMLDMLGKEVVMNVPLSVVAAENSIALETAAPSDFVSEAGKRMHDKNIGALPVVDGERVVGMFTERDALFRVINAKLDPASTLVQEVMTKDPSCVSPETTVIDAMRMVTEKHYRRFPLVDADELVGMISARDLMRWVVKEQQAEISSLNENIRGLTGTNKALIVLAIGFIVIIAIGVMSS